MAEPPLELTVRLDGRTYDVELDRELPVRVGDREVQLRVTAKETRTFRASG